MENKISDKCRKLMCYNTIVHAVDNHEVIIENCKRIIEYNDIFVKVSTKNMTIEVWGKNLLANDFNTESIIIKGNIEKIEFIEKVKG